MNYIIFNISAGKSKPVSLMVFDAGGKENSTLSDLTLSTGKYEFNFNAVNLSSGIYFYRLISGKFSETKSMILLK